MPDAESAITPKPGTARAHTLSVSRNAAGYGGGVSRAGAGLAVAGNFRGTLKGGAFSVGAPLRCQLRYRQVNECVPHDTLGMHTSMLREKQESRGLTSRNRWGGRLAN